MEQRAREYTADSVETQLHDRLRSVWAEVLELPYVDVDLDSTFLELGGESISATLCVNRILRTFGVDLSARALITDAITVRKLATLVAEAPRA
jgi:acyl carrier protein